MTFEQLDVQNNQENKKKKQLEKEKTEDFWLEKKILRESSLLLEKLAKEIANDFWIDVSRAYELISSHANSSLEDLKSSLPNSEAINIAKLNSAIVNAKTQIESKSKSSRELLMSYLESTRYSPESHKYRVSEKVFWNTLQQRAFNPQSYSDELIGLWLGIIDSTEAIILFTYSLWKWILLTPYHIYLIITWKASYTWFSRI